MIHKRCFSPSTKTSFFISFYLVFFQKYDILFCNIFKTDNSNNKNITERRSPMLDTKDLRSNFDEIKTRLALRGKDFNLEKYTDLDSTYRTLLAQVEEKKSNHNKLTKEVPAIKQSGGDASELLAQMKTMSDEITTLELDVKAKEDEIRNLLLSIPNAPSMQVPKGETDADNEVVRVVGTPTTFNFEPLPHYELGVNLNILDFESAAKVTGSRFTFYRGLGAKLERSLISFMLDTHTEAGYTEILPPVIVNSASLVGTGQLPKFEEDVFKLRDTDYYMAPTAEVPVTNIHRDQILDGAELPIKYCAYSACFRSEAGSAGRDTRGIIRQHQFNKVELVKFTKPEDSYAELESLTADAEKILQKLNIPYRVVRLCGGDMGFSSAMTYDIEVWMPSYNRYVEISSCSNFEGFQARRANIRFKDNPKDKAQTVHTLNGSGLAVGRLFAAIIENCQTQEGKIALPEAIISYMGTSTIG